MNRLSKRKKFIKKLEESIDKFKKLYIVSLDDDFVLQPGNYLCVLYMVSYRKLQIVTNKQYLYRSLKYRKNKG